MSLSHLVNSLWRSGKRTLAALAFGVSYTIPALPSISCDFTVPNHASPNYTSSDDAGAPDCVEGGSFVTESGVRIVWGADPEMFPEEMVAAPVNAQATPLCLDKYVDQAVAAVLNGLVKYPNSVLAYNLEAVYLVNRLRIYDTPAGGTIALSARRVYISSSWLFSSKPSCRAERLFHAEFSSVLLHRHLFDASRWEAVNPQDFAYGNDVAAAIRDGRVSGELDPKWAEDGFLTSYSITSIVNDFNAYAQYYFLPESLLWEIVDTYPRVQRKSSLMIEFYNQLDYQYTESFFRNLDLCGK